MRRTLVYIPKQTLLYPADSWIVIYQKLDNIMYECIVHLCVDLYEYQ